MSLVSKIGYRNHARSKSTVHDKGYPVCHVRPEEHDHLHHVLDVHVNECVQEYNIIRGELAGKVSMSAM